MAPSTISAPALAFRNTAFNPISRNSQIWLTAAELARALGYANDNAVSRIYARNQAEFPDSMSGKVNLTLPGNPLPIPVRIFSLRGAHLVAMFARTPVAAPSQKGEYCSR